MIDVNEIRSLSDFKRNTGELVDRMKETGKPMVLTVNGKAQLIVQDAAAYQSMLDEREETEATKGILRGLNDVKHGRTQPARQALEEIRKRHKIRRRT